MANNTIIIGAGRMGSSIARSLNNTSNVVVIDRNKDKISKMQDYSGFVEIGDATDRQFLEKSGIKEANRVIVVTEDDNVNIFIADMCEHIYSVNEIYVRLKDSRKRKLLSNSIVCICPFDLSLNYFESVNKNEEA